MNYLSVAEIRRFNERVLIETGGLSNAAGLERTEGSLDYLVSKVKGSLYGEEIYNTIFRKAAYYAFYVIRQHPFVDGNKRTGILCCFGFLQRNGYRLSSDLIDDEIRDQAIAIAHGRLSLDQIVSWIEKDVVM